ncbi:hypothetical protein HA44_15530 [Mixta gaviniae]|nr:hypothetical protein HA44_15530 [Mixta gaviniae]
MSHTTLLTLDGLSCGHCVKRVKEALEQREDVQQAEVSLNEARVTGDASAEALIATVEQAGYQASSQEGARPKAEPLTESDPTPEALTAEISTLPAENSPAGNAPLSTKARVEDPPRPAENSSIPPAPLSAENSLAGNAPPSTKHARKISLLRQKTAQHPLLRFRRKTARCNILRFRRRLMRPRKIISY